MDTKLHDRITAIITPSLASMGYALVQLRMIDGRRTLQVTAERSDGTGMTLEDCATISRQVSALLDVEDPIEGTYTLEVSSPGIDRPLITRADFERFAGFEAKIEAKWPIEGRRRFRGRLKGVEGEEVIMALAEGALARVPLETVQAAKLVLTDELIDWHGKKSAAH